MPLRLNFEPECRYMYWFHIYEPWCVFTAPKRECLHRISITELLIMLILWCLSPQGSVSCTQHLVHVQSACRVRRYPGDNAQPGYRWQKRPKVYFGSTRPSTPHKLLALVLTASISKRTTPLAMSPKIIVTLSPHIRLWVELQNSSSPLLSASLSPSSSQTYGQRHSWSANHPREWVTSPCASVRTVCSLCQTFYDSFQLLTCGLV